MTGLHNRYPSYFYKRGNLFNTYLSHTDGPASPPAKTKPKRKAPVTTAKVSTSVPPARQTTPVPAFTDEVDPSWEPATVGARLADFARTHLSPAETARLVRLIADDLNVSIAHRTRTEWHLPFNLGAFIDQNVDPDLAARYLKALQGRLLSGERLIQK